jgi:hypothetical protein
MLGGKKMTRDELKEKLLSLGLTKEGYRNMLQGRIDFINAEKRRARMVQGFCFLFGAVAVFAVFRFDIMRSDVIILSLPSIMFLLFWTVWHVDVVCKKLHRGFLDDLDVFREIGVFDE